MTRPDEPQDAARWQRLWSIFHRAREADDGDRERILAEVADDQSLRREVEHLLAADAAPAPLLDTPPVVATGSPVVPEMIGPYRLLSVLGEGGMGVVYEAEQREPVRRHVALKLLSGEVLSSSQRLRFEAERQALALMEHPNIAHVYDGGTTEEGRPWFVMERVEGLPITRFCDTHRLGIRERLEIFLTLCEAVQHAHQRGVIHRDLKPSNVLVAGDGTAPKVKVIDFGLAKALDRRLTDHSLRTVAGTVVGTPEYMSPEQASLDAPVDTRSDVYSLGVILYELLAGQLPFVNDGGSILDYLQRIRSGEVPPPAKRLRESDSSDRSRIAELRRASPVVLLKELDGEVKWIVLRCLEREPGRRYASAGELAGDLRRYLSGDPIIAAPPSSTYRLQKLVRRHRGFVAAAAVVILALLAGLVGTTRMAAVARAERDRAQQALIAAEDARAAAGKEAEIARATAAFVENLLTAPDPWRSSTPASARETRVVDVLRQARVELDGEVAAHPEVAGAIRRTLARTHASLGMLDEARALLEETIASTRDPLLLASLRQELGVVLKTKGAYDEAEPLFLASHRVRSALLGPEHPETFVPEVDLASIESYRGENAKAAAIYREVLSRMVPVLGETNPQVLAARNDLAVILARLGEQKEAEALHRQVLETRRSRLGSDHPDVLSSAGNYAALLHDQGRFEEALEMYRQSHETLLRVVGPAHARSVSLANNIAVVLYKLKRLDEAEAAFREVRTAYVSLLGDDHIHVLSAANNLARVLIDRGRPREALEVYREMIPLAERTQKPEHPLLATFRLGYGMSLEATGNQRDAAVQYALTHRVFEKTFGPADERTQRAAARLAATSTGALADR